MKMKALSIFFVVLIAQTQVAHGSPLFSLDILGGIIGTATGLITGVITAGLDLVQSSLQLLDVVLSSTVSTLQAFVTQGVADINNAVSGLAGIVTNFASGLSGASPKDTIGVAVTLIKDAASKIQQIVEQALAPFANFNSAISDLLLNNTAFMSNPIKSIKDAILVMSNAINQNDPFQTAVEVVHKAASLIGNVLGPTAESIGTVIAKIGTSVPPTVSSGFNGLNSVSKNIDNAFNAVLNLINAYATEAAAAPQGLATTILPLTTTLSTAVNTVLNAVKSIPVAGNAAVNGLYNAGSELLSVVTARRNEMVAVIAGVGTACAKEVATAVDNLAASACAIGVECVYNEISTIQNFIFQFQNNAGQYQSGNTTKTVSISALKQTVQNAVSFKLYLVSAKLKMSSCFADTLLNFAVDFLPLAEQAVTCAA